MLCQVSTEFIILVNRVELNNGIFGNTVHQIFVGHDGSVYMEEIFKTLKGDEKLHDSVSHTFEEFSEKFPKDAEIIREFVRKNGVKIPGIEKGCNV